MKSLVPLVRRVRNAARRAAAPVLAVPWLCAWAPGLALAAGTGDVHAQAARPAAAALARMTVTELERAFWICDWTTTTSVLDADAFTACAATADELKARKFDGDFDRMIDWWRENKAAAHARLQTRRPAAGPRR
ncbi:MAG: hypothetical protein QM750_15625 [Rubrivivax sp.]